MRRDFIDVFEGYPGSLERTAGVLLDKGVDPSTAAQVALTTPDALTVVYGKVSGEFRREDSINTHALERLQPTYEGSPIENRDLDLAVAGNRRNGFAELFSAGATRAISGEFTRFVTLNSLEKEVADKVASVPIAIIGTGAAGIITSAVLRDMGFTGITHFEKRKDTQGIWRQDNVAAGTKNNPF